MTTSPASAPAPRPGPRLFLDSADPEVWRRFLPLGCFFGVTTNPLLLERARQECSLDHLTTLAATARELGAAEIHLQVWGRDEAKWFERGLRLADLAGDGLAVAVKVPATEAGFRTAARLAARGVRLTVTAVYDPGQVLLAAGLGAAYAAPYLGRLDDAGRDGRQLAAAMLEILVRCGSVTRLLTASLRSAALVTELAAAGQDTFTFGADVAEELLDVDLTRTAAADFERAAAAMEP